MQISAISLDDWLQKWIPGILRSGRLGSGFPTADDQEIIVSPDWLRYDLQEEFAKYE